MAVLRDMTSVVEGRQLLAEQFRVHETSESVDRGAVLSVLHGDLAAHRVRGYLSAQDSQRVQDNFTASQQVRPRYGQGEDGVEAFILGASHIDKTTDDYLSDAAGAADSVADLYRGTVDPFARLRTVVTGLAGIHTVRAAEHSGRRAGTSKAVKWNNTGEYLLLPHEDLAQLSDPLQKGFEIQGIKRVMAVNVYPAVPPGTGQLRVWNVEPDRTSRHRLGLSHSGYPYPLPALHGHESLTVPVESGDLLLLNGNLVHAVLGGVPRTEKRQHRLLLTCFTGLSDDGEFLWWT